MSGLQREVLRLHLKGVAPSMIREPDFLQIRVSVFESAANDESWRQLRIPIVTQAASGFPGTQLPVCGISPLSKFRTGVPIRPVRSQN